MYYKKHNGNKRWEDIMVDHQYLRISKAIEGAKSQKHSKRNYNNKKNINIGVDRSPFTCTACLFILCFYPPLKVPPIGPLA
jgi:hypothetical protein